METQRIGAPYYGGTRRPMVSHVTSLLDYDQIQLGKRVGVGGAGGATPKEHDNSPPTHGVYTKKTTLVLVSQVSESVDVSSHLFL